MPAVRWTDDGLDRLARQVDTLVPVVTEVAVMKAELRANTEATKQLTAQMEKAQVEPMTRGRERRAQLLIALAAAATGGGIAVLGAVIASHP